MIALGAALLVNYDLFSYGLGAEMLNFGALDRLYGGQCRGVCALLSAQRRKDNDEPDSAGCRIPDLFVLWLNLSRPAKIAGTVWMVVGIAFGAWKTKGFRSNLVDFELPPEES